MSGPEAQQLWVGRWFWLGLPLPSWFLQASAASCTWSVQVQGGPHHLGVVAIVAKSCQQLMGQEGPMVGGFLAIPWRKVRMSCVASRVKLVTWP